MATFSSLAGRLSPDKQNVFIMILGAGFATVGAAIVSLHAMHELSTLNAVALLLAPALLVAVWLRPAWVILILMALPPVLLGSFRYRPLSLILLATVCAQLIVRGRAYLDFRSGLYPLLALVAMALIYKADVDSQAAFAADTFFKQFSYYLLLALTAYNAARLGDLKGRPLLTAILIGIWITVILKIAVTGLGPVPHALEEGDQAGSLFFGRKFAYLAVIGFAVHFVRWLSPPATHRLRDSRAVSGVLAGFLLVLISLSLVRAAWLAALLVILFVSAYKRKPLYWAVIPLALILAVSLPVARERVVPSEMASQDITTGRWTLWSNIWTQEVEPALPWGNGFGYAWSLTPETVFGFTTFQFGDVESDRFLYLHSSLLFWLVEFGVPGIVLFVLYWTGLASATVRLLRHSEPFARDITLALLGVLAAMLIAQIVGSGYTFRALSERFFVATGFLFGLAARGRAQQESQVPSGLAAAHEGLSPSFQRG